MFLVALLGCQALASEWKSEDLFENKMKLPPGFGWGRLENKMKLPPGFGRGRLENKMKLPPGFGWGRLENDLENGFWDWLVKVGKIVIGWFLNRDVHFDENSFLDAVERQLGRTFTTRQFTRTRVEGGTWIHGHADELVLSAYNHPLRNHSVAIRSGATAKLLPEKIESAPPGCWAIAFGNPGSAEGNEALYKLD